MHNKHLLAATFATSIYISVIVCLQKQRAEWLNVQEMIHFSDTTDDEDSDVEEVQPAEPARKKRKLTKKQRDEAFPRDQLKMQAITALRKIHSGLQMQSDGVASLEAVCKDTPLAQLPSLLMSVGLGIQSSAPGLRHQPKLHLKTEPMEAEGAQSGPSTPQPQPSTSAPKVKSEAEEEAASREAVPLWVYGGAYKCSACDKVLGSKGGCLSHIARVHTGESYLCPICEWSSTNIDSVRRHVREKHN